MAYDKKRQLRLHTTGMVFLDGGENCLCRFSFASNAAAGSFLHQSVEF